MFAPGWLPLILAAAQHLSLSVRCRRLPSIASLCSCFPSRLFEFAFSRAVSRNACLLLIPLDAAASQRHPHAWRSLRSKSRAPDGRAARRHLQGRSCVRLAASGLSKSTSVTIERGLATQTYRKWILNAVVAASSLQRALWCRLSNTRHFLDATFATSAASSS